MGRVVVNFMYVQPTVCNQVRSFLTPLFYTGEHFNRYCVYINYIVTC